MLKKEYDVLRDLAAQVAEAAAAPEMAERARLWKSCNALKPERPMLYVDPQNGWRELVPDSALVCDDPFGRELEYRLRQLIFRRRFIYDDYPFTREFPVAVCISKSGYGLENKTVDSGYAGGAYHIDPSLTSEADMAKLHAADISVDYKATVERMLIAQYALGDYLNVVPAGVGGFRYGLTRILIHWRGLDNLMYDLYDNPGLIHKLMRFLCEQQMREAGFFEDNGLLSLNNRPYSVTGSGGITLNDELPADGFAGRVRLKDMIVWGESQEFSSVGPAQFEEFVLQYQLPLLNRFGLVDYGCCEPLDAKFDLLVKHLPRLRWLSVSPWSDRRAAAEKIGGKYVYVYKPNPSKICSPAPDYASASAELRETVGIARGCPMHIIMKDTNTFYNQPERITRWSELASQIIGAI